MLDTNVATRLIARRPSAHARHILKYIIETFTEIRCAVILHEMLRGRQLVPPQRRRGGHGVTEDVFGMYGHADLSTPTFADWKQAGLAMQELPNREPTYLRKMSNDALIAAICIRNDYLLVTGDGDFGELRRTRRMAKLRLLRWEELERQVTLTLEG